MLHQMTVREPEESLANVLLNPLCSPEGSKGIALLISAPTPGAEAGPPFPSTSPLCAGSELQEGTGGDSCSSPSLLSQNPAEPPELLAPGICCVIWGQGRALPLGTGAEPGSGCGGKGTFPRCHWGLGALLRAGRAQPCPNLLRGLFAMEQGPAGEGTALPGLG